MLVGYSSSSEEESEATDRNKSFSRKCQEEDGGNNASLTRKKPKIEEQVAKTRCSVVPSRTFLGMEVCAGHAQLLDLAQAVDRTMKEFRLDTFYTEPSFHVSLAWCVGDLTGQMEECIQEMQSLIDDHEEGPFLLRLDCVELRCSTGNKTFRFPLEP
ncbi:U6 snRNA phosphodiesterase 1 [Anarrhichthys ocellatus]|uniref:U6 snRNA phosphodiesterase 1 n=1 Tax=Anarrhichthys ocellatus TaxID=433405 RepID=UPI0012EDECB6|nr:U6 snRNA phosphodiesterase [Anarrhichthys ocellatus]